MTDEAATFAAVFAALFAAHSVADHWVQTQYQADTKGCAGWVGRLAGVRHVATLTLTQLAAVAVLIPALGLRLSIGNLVAGLAVNAVTHWWADRRHTLRWLADHVGKSVFYRLGAPREGREDNPSIGTGSYALDQSFHIGWLFIAALIIAG